MEPWLIQVLVSMLFGGLAGGVLTLICNALIAKRAADAREKAMVASLQGEIEHILSLCDYNAKLQSDAIAPFVRFPLVIMPKTTFEERHFFPHLTALQKDLEMLTLGIMQVNELIHLRELIWTTTDIGASKPQAWRDDLRNLICEICADKKELAGADPDHRRYLRYLAENVLQEVGQVRAKIS